MAYQQVHTLLQHAECFHHGVAERYERMARDGVSTRVAMLLDYLSGHERVIGRMIASSREAASDGVLNTWITTTRETALLAAPEELVDFPEPGTATVDDVLELALKLDEQAIATYEDIVARDVPSTVIDIFKNLLEMERNEEKMMVKQSARGAEL